MDNREDGAIPSQPRYCNGYSAGTRPLVTGQGRRLSEVRCLSQETCRDTISLRVVSAGWQAANRPALMAYVEDAMKRVFFATLLLVTLGATGSRAQSEEEPDSRDPHQLSDSIVVTANRFGVEPKKSVWPVSAVNVDQLKGESSLESALDGCAGVDIRQSNGIGSVATLSNWGTFNRQMLLLYDGRVVKDYSLGGFNLSDYSPEEFERIEILKGPQSAYYGADAVGGVVNLIPKNSLSDRLEVDAMYGTFNHRQLYMDAARYNEALGIGVGGFAEFTASDNHRDNAGARRLSFGLRSDFLSSSNKHRLSISGRYFDDSLGVPGPVPDPQYIPVYGSSESSSLTTYQADENYSIDMSYRFYDKAVGEAQLDLFWEKKNLDYHSLYNYQAYYYTPDGGDSVLTIDSVDVASRSIYNKRSAGVNARILRNLGSLDLAGGIDWLSGSLRATSDDTSYVSNLAGPFAPSQYDYNQFNYWAGSQNQTDFWGAADYQPADVLTLNASGRLQFIRNRDTQTSYNVGAVVSLTSAIRFKAGYGYAFRLPTIAEQFADDVYTAGNADLSPETSRSIHGSFEWVSTAGYGSVRATVFRQTIDSLIQYRHDPTIFRSVPQNVEKFRSTGLDLTCAIRPVDFLRATWSGVYQHARQTTDDGSLFVPAFYVPEIKWRTDITAYPSKSFAVNFNCTYTGDRGIVLYGGVPKTIEKVYELGLSVTAQLADHVSLKLTGYDLTDRGRPDQFGYTLSDRDYPTPGRRVVLDMSYDLL